ncbi:MAG TPA: MBL fold metallo-hydrolase [Thermoleophilaceae bacterium]|jgi:glyoxylase-like metal-dependent hydrolase (beta-lactamase superfamily II)
MKQIADGLYQLKGFPPNMFNAYLMGDVLVDSATRFARRRILRQLDGREVTAHALTHAHPDHQGSSDAVCAKLGLPYWVGERDVEAAEGGGPAILRKQPGHPRNRFSARFLAGPGRQVDRVLREGDELAAGFEVIETPGHSLGHLSFWRESDRALILGDVLFGMHPSTGVPGLHEPPVPFTPDPPRNRESARRLAPLEPALVCFGHGPPLRDARRFVDFVQGLPAS